MLKIPSNTDLSTIFGTDLINTRDILKCVPQNSVDYYVGDNEALLSNQTLLFSYIDKNRDKYIKQSYSEEYMHELLDVYYYPENKGNFEFFYDQIPQAEYFRLFVDVSKQRDPKEKGFCGYEQREPGCIQSMYDAFEYIMSSIEAPLTVEYIQSIHKIAAANIPPFVRFVGWGDEIKESIQPGQFKQHKSGTILMDVDTITPLGYKDMILKFRASDCYMDNQKFRIMLGFPENGFINEVNNIISEYEINVKKDSPYEKLKAIVALAQCLDRAHPFKDGNIRVFATLLMNRELVKHGFSPSLMNDPNILDGHSLEESMRQVIFGMENFKFLRTNGCMPGCITTEEILSSGETYPIIFKEKLLPSSYKI
tara:strand:+ start:15263 stop:16363 length:1101 start_codon:yes stop_codon:yes gene_type:complete